MQSGASDSEADARRRLDTIAGETQRRLRLIEEAIHKEEARQTEQTNAINQTRAGVRELNDAIGKSRRRESELVRQVDLWVNLINDHKTTLLNDEVRETSVCVETTQLCDNIEANMRLLRHKRENVQLKTEELATFKSVHGELLKEMKKDIKQMQDELKLWEARKLGNQRSLANLNEKKMVTEGTLKAKKEILQKIKLHCCQLSTLIRSHKLIEEEKCRPPVKEVATQMHIVAPPQRAVALDLRPQLATEDAFGSGLQYRSMDQTNECDQSATLNTDSLNRESNCLRNRMTSNMVYPSADVPSRADPRHVQGSTRLIQNQNLYTSLEVSPKSAKIDPDNGTWPNCLPENNSNTSEQRLMHKYTYSSLSATSITLSGESGNVKRIAGRLRGKASDVSFN